MPNLYDADLYADQLNIDTPEQVALHFPIAGIGSRFIAVLLDMLLQLGAFLLMILVIYLAALSTHALNKPSTPDRTADKWAQAGVILFIFLITWGYYSLFEGLWHGQTPGKRIMKLRVLKDSGRSITLFESLARNLVRYVDYLPGIYAIGLISILCNRQNKRLGDFVAGTIVVHERVEEQPLLAYTAPPTSMGVDSARFAFAGAPPPPPTSRLLPQAQATWERHQSELPADAVARLGPAELHVIETFFYRALDLNVEIRAGLGARVAARMAARMRQPVPAGMDSERFLELIAYRMRSQGR